MKILQAEKKKIRLELLKQRQALSTEVWLEKSTKICQLLQQTLLWQNCTTILSYFSTKQEPDLTQLFLSGSQYQWGFPRCLTDSSLLQWHRVKSDDILQKNCYGIDEPLSSYPLIDLTKVDLMLVPAIACDYQGFRLGYGGGYYDRMLSLPLYQNIPTIGIVFDFCFLPQLPINKWDQKLDYICTDLDFYSINK